MAYSHMALLTFIIILTLRTVIANANNGGYFANITAIILVNGWYVNNLFSKI